MGQYADACYEDCNDGSASAMLFHGPHVKGLLASKYRLKLEGVTTNFTSSQNFFDAFKVRVMKWGGGAEYADKVYGEKSWSFDDMENNQTFVYDFDYDGIPFKKGDGTVAGLQFYIFIYSGCFRFGKLTLYELNT